MDQNQPVGHFQVPKPLTFQMRPNAERFNDHRQERLQGPHSNPDSATAKQVSLELFDRDLCTN